MKGTKCAAVSAASFSTDRHVSENDSWFSLAIIQGTWFLWVNQLYVKQEVTAESITDRLQNGMCMPCTPTNGLFLFREKPTIVSSVHPIFMSSAAANELCLMKKVHLLKRWHICRAFDATDPPFSWRAAPCRYHLQTETWTHCDTHSYQIERLRAMSFKEEKNKHRH